MKKFNPLLHIDFSAHELTRAKEIITPDELPSRTSTRKAEAGVMYSPNGLCN